MWTNVWTSVIAVIGTLAGGLLTGILQARVARTTRAEDRQTARRDAQLAAVVALVEALGAHRRAMWVRENWTLTGESAERVEAARAEVYATRREITAPLTTVQLVAPQLAENARAAVDAVRAMRRAPSCEELDALRTAAGEASDRLVAAAAAHLTPA
ncbi:protein kilB [Actinomadura kijaniata]|uniref:protein kilB n=1 Tax=Actinomadura kijaniata TaxID=46161 RepID=UPI003F1953F7